MWRLLAVVALVALVWCVNTVLPAGNGEEQLRAVTGIAAGAAPPVSKAASVSKVVTMGADAQALEPEPPIEASPNLVLSLQEELTRVGCYKGALDGNWNSATQRAAARFAGRAKTKIAADAPSAALLPLVVRFSDRACGAACPPGTQPDRQGSCMTKQVVALAATAQRDPYTPLTRDKVQAASSTIVEPGRAAGIPASKQKSPSTQSSASTASPAALAGKPAVPEAIANRSRLASNAKSGSGLYAPPAPGGIDPAQETSLKAPSLAGPAVPPGLAGAVPAEAVRPQDAAQPARLAAIRDNLAPRAQNPAAALPAPVVATQTNLAALNSQVAEAPAASTGTSAGAPPARHKRFRKPAIVRAALPQLAAAQDAPAPPPRKRRASLRTLTSSYGFSAGAGASGSSAPLIIVLSRH